MFARKGTTVRRGRRSVRRPRPSPGPPSAASPSGRHSVTLDPEAGSDSRKVTSGELGEHRPSNANSRTSSASLASSLPILDDERSLCRSTSGLSDDKFQQAASYGSILYQLKEVQDEAVDVCDFLQRFLEIAWDSLILTVFMLLLLGLPIAMIAVGSSYEHECPREPRIPIYLLVGGAFGAIEVVIVLWQQKKSRDFNYAGDDSPEDDDDFDDGMMSRSCRFTCYMLLAFLLVWFVLGNVWVLGIWKPNFRQPLHDPQNWCNEVVFFFAFYQLVAVYGLLGLALIVLVVTLAFFTLRRRFRS